MVCGHKNDTSEGQIYGTGMARAGATAAPTLPTELQAVVNAWPELPDAVRAGIIAMVKEMLAGGRDEAR